MSSENAIDSEIMTTTVLVVEDEQPLADMYAAWLTETYSVRTAYDGEQALQQLDDAVAVVLLDRRMPGLAGDDVLEKIRERDYDCRVAMVSGVNPEFDVIEMGFDDYLTKPVSQSELRETVDRLLTVATYDRQLREYFALVSKEAALKAEKSQHELETNEEYGSLKQQVAEERERLDTLLAELEGDDIRTLLRDRTATGSSRDTL